MGEPGPAFRRRSDVRFRVIAGEAVVLRQEEAEVLVLNEVGARILELADGSHSAKAIVDTLESEFEVERAELESDVETFLGDLVEADVLEPAGDASGEEPVEEEE